MTRVLIALGIAVVIYGVGVGVGSVLYATGTIATGATHNDCANYRKEIARERGISEHDVPQSEIRQRTADCLAGHELTEREAFRKEYLVWPLWPAIICAIVFLLWPVWARILHNQELAEGLAEPAAQH
jgi:hypothetical protein